MRLIRFEGHPSPFDEPEVIRAIAAHRLPLSMLKRFRRFEHHQRISAVPGRSTFAVGPDHGFSRAYQWGPHAFDAWMDDADWERLRANRWDRWMFRDVTDDPASRRRPLGKERWRELLAAFDDTPPARPPVLGAG